MTAEKLKHIVKRVKYKPGWKFRIDDGNVEVIANVPDAYHPRQKPVDPPHAYAIIRKGLTEKEIIGKIFDACQRLEFHECAEWFKYKGRRPYDTHND